MTSALLVQAMARALRAGADELDRFAAEQSADRADWIDQQRSALGPRRHGAAVRRRVAAGDAGAAVVGRRLLLSQEAHAAELAAVSRRPSRKTSKPQSVGDELRAELRLVGGAR